MEQEIISEIVTAIENLGGSHELQAVVSSWRDTMDDESTLAMLRDYNRTGTYIKEVICQIEQNYGR